MLVVVCTNDRPNVTTNTTSHHTVQHNTVRQAGRQGKKKERYTYKPKNNIVYILQKKKVLSYFEIQHFVLPNV